MSDIGRRRKKMVVGDKVRYVGNRIDLTKYGAETIEAGSPGIIESVVEDGKGYVVDFGDFSVKVLPEDIEKRE